ncbi:MAG: hypothetical protein ACOCV8_05965, partial [Spirochaetota bacterium]
MRKIKFFAYLLFIIFLCLFLSAPIYSQEANINIAVLEFTNKSGLKDFDYLSSSIQRSIYTALENTIKSNEYSDISLISMNLVNKTAKKYEINTDNLDNTANLLKFSLETKANIIIMGEYNINQEVDQLTLQIPMYNVAERNILTETSFKGDLTTDIYNFIDNISYETATEIARQREQLLINLEELYKEANPPSYEQKLNISSINIDAVKVEWQTNKETVSTLYLLDSNKFSKDSIINTYQDEGKDAINHYVNIPLEDISEGEEYYLISQDKDFLEQEVKSELLPFSYKDIYNAINTVFDEELNQYFQKSKNYANNNEYDKAIQEVNK